MLELYKNKRVLVTGAAGTIGTELIKQLLKLDVKEIKAIDNNEEALFTLNANYKQNDRVNCSFCDIRDLDRLKYLCRDMEIILHLAAMKHVEISELSPMDAIETNAKGTLNVIYAALESDSVKRVIYTSTDKAVNSTNVMGTTKLLGERLMTAALNIRSSKNIIFASTRFGNVLASKGSVVPVFFNQIKRGQDLTITHPEMTRFVMTVEEAANLVLEASLIAQGGEVFVTKMSVINILDLAHAMINLVSPIFKKEPQDTKITYIGMQPGEKKYEELMTQEETLRAIELKNMFVIKPFVKSIYTDVGCENYKDTVNCIVTKPYISTEEKKMSVSEIETYFHEHSIINRI